jgi:diaminopimelate decarboxylase
MASNYNAVARPPVLAVRDGEVSVLLRRETEEDLLRLDPGADSGADQTRSAGAFR